MGYKTYLAAPAVSTAYQLTAETNVAVRERVAFMFLSSKEFSIAGHNLEALATYDLVEEILKSKVLTYAIAFAGGATNGGALYQQARADLLTWRSIFEGALYAQGWLVK